MGLRAAHRPGPGHRGRRRERDRVLGGAGRRSARDRRGRDPDLARRRCWPRRWSARCSAASGCGLLPGAGATVALVVLGLSLAGDVPGADGADPGSGRARRAPDGDRPPARRVGRSAAPPGPRPSAWWPSTSAPAPSPRRWRRPACSWPLTDVAAHRVSRHDAQAALGVPAARAGSPMAASIASRRSCTRGNLVDHVASVRSHRAVASLVAVAGGADAAGRRLRQAARARAAPPVGHQPPRRPRTAPTSRCADPGPPKSGGTLDLRAQRRDQRLEPGARRVGRLGLHRGRGHLRPPGRVQQQGPAHALPGPVDHPQRRLHGVDHQGATRRDVPGRREVRRQCGGRQLQRATRLGADRAGVPDGDRRQGGRRR